MIQVFLSSLSQSNDHEQEREMFNINDKLKKII